MSRGRCPLLYPAPLAGRGGCGDHLPHEPSSTAYSGKNVVYVELSYNKCSPVPHPYSCTPGDMNVYTCVCGQTLPALAK